jgi:hypothetical protein
VKNQASKTDYEVSATKKIYDVALAQCSHGAPGTIFKTPKSTNTPAVRKARSKIQKAILKVSNVKALLAKYVNDHKLEEKHYLASLGVVSDDEQNAIIAADQSEEANIDLKNDQEKLKTRQDRLVSLTKKYKAAVVDESQCKKDEKQTLVAFDKAKVEAAKDAANGAKKLAWMKEDVKIKAVAAKKSDVVLKDAYQAYKEAETRAERAATIKKVGPASAANEKAIEDLQDAKDALESYEAKRKDDLITAKYTEDQMLEETKRAASEYQVAILKTKKLLKRKVALEAQIKATEQIVAKLMARVAKMKTIMDKMSLGVKGVIAKRAAQKALVASKKQLIKDTKAALKTAVVAVTTAKDEYDAQLLTEEKTISSKLHKARGVKVTAFGAKWESLKREITANDMDYQKLMECNKNSEWTCAA